MIAVARDGRVVSDTSGGASVPWWSFTKTAIAAAILRLAETGTLDLDAPVPTGGSLRHLLRHTGGVPDYGGAPAYHAAVASGEAPWPAAELYRRMDADRPLFAPGDGWAYSNIGYLILRERLQAATGLPLEAALRKLVLDPLGVESRILTSPEDASGLPGLAEGYHPGWVYHGLLAGPLGEAARLLDGLLSGRLLSPKALADMLAPRLLYVAVGDRPWREPGYGLGVMTGLVDRHRPAGHTGGGPGSVVAVYGREGQAVAAFLPGDDVATVERAAIEALP